MVELGLPLPARFQTQPTGANSKGDSNGPDADEIAAIVEEALSNA